MFGPGPVHYSKPTSSLNESIHALSVFLFLLGHTHNLLRSVLHVLFAQQVQSIKPSCSQGSTRLPKLLNFSASERGGGAVISKKIFSSQIA